MMPKDVINMAAEIFAERGEMYGDIRPLFKNAAQLASIITGKEFSEYDICVVMEAVKLARRRANPKLADHYIDNVNYTAFSAHFALNDHEGEQAAALAQPPVETGEHYAQEISVHFDGVCTTILASPRD